MGINDWQARYAKVGTYEVGDMAYWDTAVTYGKGFAKGQVVKVTKTQVVVDTHTGEKIFRLQPSRGIFLAGKGDYHKETLITPDCALGMQERYDREMAIRTAQGRVRQAAAGLDTRFPTVEKIEEAIKILEVQALILKSLKDS